jgi:DNA-binding response OmpR family regulator
LTEVHKKKGLLVTGERVLVVDDDKALLGMICEDLLKQGYACETVHSDRDAYRRLVDDPGFDVMLVDIALGEGTTGFDVARFARRAKPELRVIYMSGEANARSWMSFGVPSSDYLSKPFTLDKLAALLAAIKGEEGEEPSL